MTDPKLPQPQQPTKLPPSNTPALPPAGNASVGSPPKVQTPSIPGSAPANKPLPQSPVQPQTQNLPGTTPKPTPPPSSSSSAPQVHLPSAPASAPTPLVTPKPTSGVQTNPNTSLSGKINTPSPTTSQTVTPNTSPTTIQPTPPKPVGPMASSSPPTGQPTVKPNVGVPPVPNTPKTPLPPPTPNTPPQSRPTNVAPTSSASVSAQQPSRSPIPPASSAKPMTPSPSTSPNAPKMSPTPDSANPTSSAPTLTKAPAPSVGGASSTPVPGGPQRPMPPGQTPPQAGKPLSAPPKRSILRFLPIILILLVVVGVIGFLATRFLGRGQGPISNDPEEKTEITYWGLWEPTTVMAEVIADFEQQNPQYKITYVQQNPSQYRERLQTAITQGQGPDIFRFHASWVPMLTNELSPVPASIMSSEEFTQTYYPVAQRQLNVNGNIMGIPLMYEGLALFYNTQIFQIANVTPPKDWEEMKQVAQTLTVRSGSSITRAGIALGTANNVEHYSDILGLMLYQNKRQDDPQQYDLSNVSTQEARDAIDFYVSFARDLEVWNSSFPNATETFARGDVAMMIAPSWRAHEVRAKNPNLTFAVAPIPQIPGGEKITWASYWAEGVSTTSQQKQIAWNFIKYLSSPDVQRKLHSDAKRERAFGEIYSRVDLASEIVTDPLVGAYVEDAPSARGWYLSGFTHDNGINDRINKYFEDAVNQMNQNASAESVLTTVQQGINQVLQQYGVASAGPTTSQQ